MNKYIQRALVIGFLSNTISSYAYSMDLSSPVAAFTDAQKRQIKRQMESMERLRENGPEEEKITADPTPHKSHSVEVHNNHSIVIQPPTAER